MSRSMFTVSLIIDEGLLLITSVSSGYLLPTRLLTVLPLLSSRPLGLISLLPASPVLQLKLVYLLGLAIHLLLGRLHPGLRQVLVYPRVNGSDQGLGVVSACSS